MAHLLIDGYNLIRQSAEFSKEESKKLEKGRLALLKSLALYKNLKGHQITVVFDAALTDNVYLEEDLYQGIRIFYTESNQSADEVLMEMIERKNSNYIVVTSDKTILKAAKSARIGFLEAPEFEKKLREAALYGEGFSKDTDEEEGPLHKRWTTYKKGPSKRLPKAKRQAHNWLKKL